MQLSQTLNVLIVDDEAIVHDTLKEFIQDLGHQVHSVFNGQEALQTISKVHFDLALIDVRMPGMDGLELLEQVRTQKPDLPVVMLTGHGDPTMSEKAKTLGARDFIIKPISLIVLMDLLDQVR